MRTLLSSVTLAATFGATLVTGLAAPALAEGLTFTRDISVEVDSAYVFRGVQQADETFRLNAQLRFNGVYGGVTFLQPLDGDDFSNEARLYGAWSPHIEDHGSPFDVEFGFTYYITPDAAPGLADDARFEPYGAIFFDVPLMPSVHGFYDVELEAFTVEGRTSHYVPLDGLTGLDLSFDAGHVSPDNAMEHSYAKGSIDLVRNFLNGIEGYVGVRGAISSQDTFFDNVTAVGPVFDQETKVWISAGVTATF